MLAFAVRGVVLLGVLSWYSATVWKMIDGYFKDQFRTYLQEEYRKYPRLKSNVKITEAVDKGPALNALPTEFSRVGETYGLDAVCPADIADTYSRRTDSEKKKTVKDVTGSSSENAAASVGSTDKNAFSKSAAQSMLESRKLSSGSDTHSENRRPGVINQNDGHEEKAIERSGIGDTSSSSVPPLSRPEKPRHRHRKKRPVSKESSREGSTKRRVKTIVFTDVDFAGAKTDDDGYNDFSEFEEENEKNQRISKEGIPVSELPFKPKADIGALDRVTAEEFCPLTLEDDASCGETTTWS